VYWALIGEIVRTDEEEYGQKMSPARCYASIRVKTRAIVIDVPVAVNVMGDKYDDYQR